MALKEENLKLKNKKIKKYTNRKLYTFLFASIFIYAFFFLSNLFMPPTFEGVETLKIGSSVEMESRKLTLLSWTYSKEQQKMEVILGLENLSLDGVKKYDWKILDKFGVKKSKVIMETEDIIVLNIYDIKEDFTELKLIMGIRKEDKDIKTNFTELSFYTNNKIVTKVENIKEKTAKEYYKDATDSLIRGLEKNIAEEEKNIKELEEKIEIAEKKIKDLKNDMKFQTSAEKEISIEKILEIGDKVKDYQDDIKESKSKVKEIKKKIILKQKQVEGEK